MASIPLFPLRGRVPVIHETNMSAEIVRQADAFRGQLSDWGFMAFEIPGVNQRIRVLEAAFGQALAAEGPSLGDYSYKKIRQTSTGNHGFFPFASEIPRLSGGVADPKEFVHVSGAMLTDLPPGCGALLEAFPQLARYARTVFANGLTAAQAFGEVVRSALPMDAAPSLQLDARASILRIIHYTALGESAVLAHEHSGIQMLGLQFPPSHGGLQYVLNDGTWVEPELVGTDVVLCNIGRMITEASGGQLRPSTHRVLRTDEVRSERWSTVLFVHPDHEAARWTVSADGKVRALPETWGDFVRNQVAGLGVTVDPAYSEEVADESAGDARGAGASG